jgi:hypothetical protein
MGPHRLKEDLEVEGGVVLLLLLLLLVGTDVGVGAVVAVAVVEYGPETTKSWTHWSVGIL